MLYILWAYPIASRSRWWWFVKAYLSETGNKTNPTYTDDCAWLCQSNTNKQKQTDYLNKHKQQKTTAMTTTATTTTSAITTVLLLLGLLLLQPWRRRRLLPLLVPPFRRHSYRSLVAQHHPAKQGCLRHGPGWAPWAPWSVEHGPLASPQRTASDAPNHHWSPTYCDKSQELTHTP